MSVSTTRNMERERLRRFVRYWDRLLEIVPEARREAVQAAGETVKGALDGQIQSAGLSGAEAKGRVKSWQRLRLGSGGGWAAVSAMKGTVYSRDRRAGFGARETALKAADKVLCRIADEVDF